MIKRRGVERVPRPPGPELARRQATQLVIDLRQETLGPRPDGLPPAGGGGEAGFDSTGAVADGFASLGCGIVIPVGVDDLH